MIVWAGRELYTAVITERLSRKIETWLTSSGSVSSAGPGCPWAAGRERLVILISPVGTGQFLKRKGFKSEIFQEEIIQEEIIQVEIIQVGNDRSKKSYKWEMIEVRKLTSRNL